MKKTVLISLSIVVLFLLVLIGLYLFRKPTWKYTLDTQDTYLNDTLYSIEDSYVVGTFWVDYIVQDGNGTHLYVMNTDFKSVLLSKDLGLVVDDIDFIKQNEGGSYPVFLSLRYELESKSIVDEVLCSYVGGDYCLRGKELREWKLYSNTYPFPEVSKQQGLDILTNTVDYLIGNGLYNSDYPTCEDILAKYLYNISIGNTDVLEGIANDYIGMQECPNIKGQLDYAYLLLPYSDSTVSNIYSRVCSELDSMEYSKIERYFTNINLDTISNICNAKDVVSNMVAGEDDVYREDYGLRYELRYLLVNMGSEELNSMREYIGSKLLSSKYSYMYLKDVVYTEEVIYLSRLLMNE